MVGTLITKRLAQRTGVLFVALMLATMQVYPAFAASACVNMMCEPAPVAEPAQPMPSCHAAATEDSASTPDAPPSSSGANPVSSCCSLDQAAPPYSAYTSASQAIRTVAKHLTGCLPEHTTSIARTISVATDAHAPDESPPGEIRLYLSNASFLL